MARKSKRTMKALSGLTRKVSAIHPSSGSLISGKHASTMKNPHRDDSSNPTQMQAGSPGLGSSASSVTSSIDGADGNEDDGAEEDPDEDDNGDADEMAPSDAAIASNGHQTGPIIGRSLKHNPSSGEKQKHSLDNIGKKKQRAHRRKASKSIGQVEDENAGFDDDDDYHGVDLISDSEEEEPTVEQLEEKVIIESEEEYDSNCRTPPVLPSISSDGWPGFELEGNLFLSDVPYFDEQIGRTDPSILAEEIEIFNTTNFSQGFCDIEVPPRLTPARRVRFAEDVEEPDNASTVVSDTKGGSLGLAKREEGVTSENHDSEDEDTDSTSGRSSGYETDLGETTEEEDVPASATTRPQALLRRASMSSFQGGALTTPTPRRRLPPTPPGYRWGPHMGSWIADPTKPIAIVDSTGTKVVIFPPQRPKKPNQVFASLGSSASSAHSSPRLSIPQLASAIDDSEIEQSGRSSQDPVSPMFGSSPNLMMSGLLNVGSGNEHLPGGQVLGPPEAFFPFTNFDAGGNVIMDEDDDEDEDDLLNLNDFIDFGEDTDDSDNQGAVNEPHSPSVSSMTSAVSATVKPEETPSGNSSAPNLMDHLDNGVVTAFRRSQHNQKTAQRRPSDGSPQRANLAFKGGRHAAADAPLSPLKKRRLSDAFDGEHGTSPPHGAAVKRRILNTH